MMRGCDHPAIAHNRPKQTPSPTRYRPSRPQSRPLPPSHRQTPPARNDDRSDPATTDPGGLRGDPEDHKARRETVPRRALAPPLRDAHAKSYGCDARAALSSAVASTCQPSARRIINQPQSRSSPSGVKPSPRPRSQYGSPSGWCPELTEALPQQAGRRARPCRRRPTNGARPVQADKVADSQGRTNHQGAHE